MYFVYVYLNIFFFLFRYLTLFMNLLNDCSEEEQDKAMDPNRKRSMSNLSALRHCTVQAMSNLLNANIESGLMNSIGKVLFIFKY